ncbi:MAG: aspartyl protease family protein, partial [Candidatus Acidiferrales bacterium]
EFAFEPMGNHILVPVRVNGSQPAWFFFDSGADLSVVDAAWAKKLGLSSKGSIGISGTGEGSAELGMLSNISFALPGVVVPVKSSAAVSLAPLLPFFGREISGIIGYDVISRFVVEIDYAGHKLHLHDPADYHYSGHGTAVLFSFLGNKPLVHAKVSMEGQPPLEGEYTIDTGSGSFVAFASPFVDSHHLLAAGYKTIDSPSAGIGGISRDVAGRLTRFQIGPYILPDAIASFSRDTRGSGANRNQAGNIGGELLRRFTVVFDYSHQVMYLEPNSQFNDPYDAGMSGLSLVSAPPDFSAFRVAFILPDSPAEVAGMKVGDKVTAIDGKPVKEIPLSSTSKMFRQDGRVYLFTVQRDGKTMDVSVKMRRMI